MARDMASASQAPKLAVIIPNYNYGRFVTQAIDSVLMQQREDVELIVVDDGSTDNSWQIIAAYGLALRAFRLTNGGQARACLFGVAQTSAPFVLFLDADDELYAGSLEKILSHLDPSVAKLQYSLMPIDETGQVCGIPRPLLADFRDRNNLIQTILREGEYVTSPTSGNVFARHLFARIGEIPYEPVIDGITLMAAPFFGDIISIREPLGKYRLHGTNFSAIQKVSAARFAREAQRLSDRLDHLREILKRAGVTPYTIPDGRRLFYYTERRLYEEVADGRRPKLATLLRYTGALWRAPKPLRQKLIWSLLAAALFVLPAAQREAILAYRFHPAERSLAGLLRRLMRQPRHVPVSQS
jgi:glycosyltransferase involved in cell wall biosynthesis